MVRTRILKPIITKTIWTLSLVSLFTDMASEMLYPIMPIYLKTIGFSVLLIGILEGIAEATAGLSKGYFGKLSDHSGKRTPFVQVGYALSAISKPLMAAFAYPIWIFFARTIDRIGKGVRTGARDAILSDEATPQTKAKVFGFHRSMDTFGAVLGPLFALGFLYFYPQNYKMLFVIAFAPGLLSILFTLFLKDKYAIIEKGLNKSMGSTKSKRIGFFSFIKYWKSSPADYRKLSIGLLVFTLFNSSDVFLLLKAKEAGLDDSKVIAVYIFYNLIYALFAFPLGALADKIGIKKVLLAGFGLYAIVYFGMGIFSSLYAIGGLFLLYGIYAAATEGLSKAWISNISDKKDIATAIGTFASFQSICAMFASAIAGFVWFQFGSEACFFLTGAAAISVIIYFILVKIKG